VLNRNYICPAGNCIYKISGNYLAGFLSIGLVESISNSNEVLVFGLILPILDTILEN